MRSRSRTSLTWRKDRCVSNFSQSSCIIPLTCATSLAAEEVLKVLDEAWLEVSPYATNYFH